MVKVNVFAGCFPVSVGQFPAFVAIIPVFVANNSVFVTEKLIRIEILITIPGYLFLKVTNEKANEFCNLSDAGECFT